MLWLGVRCWTNQIALVAVADAAGRPEVVFRRRQGGAGIADAGERCAWFGKMAEEALEESGAEGLAVRVADSNPDQARASAEGAVLAVAGAQGLPTMELRRQSLLKPLGAGREAGAWKAFQKEDAFIGSLVGDEKDAAMASLGAARR